MNDDDLAQYVFMGISAEKVEPYHALTVQLRNGLFKDELHRNLFLNDGYQFTGKPPESFFDLTNAVWRRSAVAIQLQYVNHVVDIVTQPLLLHASRPLIAGPEVLALTTLEMSLDDAVDVKTSQGYDLAKVEAYQNLWFTDNETRDMVRQFQRTLEQSFAQFNLQFMLERMDRVRIQNLHGWEEEEKIQRDIKQCFSPKGYTALDNAYYNRASSFMRKAAQPWTQLNRTEFGQLFILQEDEVQRGLAQSMGAAEIISL